MAAAQAPSIPAAFTDNDMTLPWDNPLDDPQGLHPMGSAKQGGDAALNTESRVSEASHEPEQPVEEAAILPDTQANDLPTGLPASTASGSPERPSGPQDIAFGEPTQLAGAHTHLTGEPTQFIGEPTQLAMPAHPVPVPPAALPPSQAGTALASAAAQAMTGAHPSQASVLPASGGFPTAMPSLSPHQPARQPSPAGSPHGHSSGPEQGTSDSLPISRPQADAVLHLPSQPSGSQHAAHPHGAPRTHGGSAAAVAAAAAKKPASHVSQPQQQSEHGEPSHQEETQAPSENVQRDTTLARADSSEHNTLLDSVLGHDDDDSIWMPPASLPDSQGPNAGAEPASLPAEGGQNMPLQTHMPTAGGDHIHILTAFSLLVTPHRAFSCLPACS